MKKSKAAAIFFLLLSLVPGYFALSYYAEARGFMARAVETTAEITHYAWAQETAGSYSDNSFRPWVGFTHTDGSQISAPTNLFTENDVHSIGEEIRILYDPAHVATVRVKSFEGLWALPTFFGVPALLLFLFGLYRMPWGGARPCASAA